ncbi:ABC transporter ATP-binding protein/permease [Cyanobium sp. Morenito 9A2]|nr:ABC transporter ATP-binding protein/permease [Cyanobium sp. Morenito 9A2]
MPHSLRLKHLIRQLLSPLLGTFLSRQPAAQLIRETARRQWKLLVVNLLSSLLESASEGATFGVIFLVVELLSNTHAPTAVTWASKPVVSWITGAPAWLAGLPTTPLFLALLVLAVMLQLVQSLTRYAGLVSIGYFAARCKAQVTARIHSQILRLSYPCASAYRVGDLTDYAAGGPDAIRTQIEAASQILVTTLLIAVYLGILLRLSPWLLLAAGALGGLITSVQRALLPRLRTGAHQVSGIQAEIAARITEDIQALRLLHSSGQRQSADQALRSRMGELEGSLRRQSRLMNVIGPFSSFLPIAAIAVMGGLSLLVFGSKTSGVLPSLVTFVLALQRLNVRFSSLAGLFNQLADNAGRIGRLNAILSPGGKAFAQEGGVPFLGLGQEIRLEQVHLSYGGSGPDALKGIDLVIPKGATVALVGPSGAGKSSIADLLAGLYEPSRGRVLIDGQDLRALELGSWQQRLGVVSQDTFLFNLSLAENIAFGTPGASREQVRAAAAVAHAASFIEALPEGFDTIVGERGFRLSGGQRQRIALARAILRQPELLILDEATSALDSESERLVQDALEALDGRITKLVIAHRLGTVIQADRIVVLEAGQIVEQGNHGDLSARQGSLYQQLWLNQVGAGVG